MLPPSGARATAIHSMTDKPYLETVKDQYEVFPYPPRDPDDEHSRLILAISGNLLLINHHCFRGRRHFDSGFRCLVAGGGTGDTVIYLAEQLRGSGAEVVYLDMSEASRAVAEARVAMARQMVATLPATNSFVRDLARWRREIMTEGFGDAGFYDLLLHSQDRCFDVPGCYDLAASAGLHLLDFAWEADAYDPFTHVTDPAVRQRLESLPIAEQQALAELMVGTIRKHEFFLAREPDRRARLTEQYNTLHPFDTMLKDAGKLAVTMQPGTILQYTHRGRVMPIVCTPVTRLIFAHMDGRTTLRELRDKARQTIGGAANSFDRELADLFKQLHLRGYLYLCHRSVSLPDYATLHRDQSREAEK